MSINLQNAKDHLAWLKKTATDKQDNTRIVGYEDCLRAWILDEAARAQQEAPANGESYVSKDPQNQKIIEGMKEVHKQFADQPVDVTEGVDREAFEQWVNGFEAGELLKPSMIWRAWKEVSSRFLKRESVKDRHLKLLACATLGITPDSNTQTKEEYDATEKLIMEVARHYLAPDRYSLPDEQGWRG